MDGYSPLETAVVNRFIEYFTELKESNCKAGDIDSVFEAIFSEALDYGCFFEFDGGVDTPRKPFKVPVWVWTVSGVFLVKYGENIETKMRDIIDKLALVFDNDHTVGGVSPYVHLFQIGRSEPGEINNVPFYFIPFGIEIYDRQ